ncbi:MAG: hypothetical protein GY697_22365 [Desulfobacterales bacterium]|nr:hypothetical protein [Desulfobacterales bacterium]
MRLPAFTYLEPATLGEALEMLAVHDIQCRILAGGTDLLVRMKQRLATPPYLISLKNLGRELNFIHQDKASLSIGASTPLGRILKSESLVKAFPGLAEAVDAVGSPSIQHARGTIGGNLCQDNRCQFYNQSAFFRGARQTCHKAGGQICYAREGGSDRCHSICQSDTAPMLMALNAQIVLKQKGEQRRIPLTEFYTARGEKPHALEPGELLAQIEIPIPGTGSGCAYEKLAFRSAIDYPMASAAASVQVVHGKIKQTKLVIGAMGSAPLVISRASELLSGKSRDDENAMDKAAKAALDTAEAFAVNNLSPPTEYRVGMVAVLARRALNRSLEMAVKERSQ